MLDIRILHFEAFKEVYGFVAGDDMLRFAAMLLSEVVDELGSANDFIGHAGGDNFILITSETHAGPIQRRIKERFDEEAQSHYNFLDRERGYILSEGTDGQQQPTPLVALTVGEVSASRYEFADIREITELAAEERRKNS